MNSKVTKGHWSSQKVIEVHKSSLKSTKGHSSSQKVIGVGSLFCSYKKHSTYILIGNLYPCFNLREPSYSKIIGKLCLIHYYR